MTEKFNYWESEKRNLIKMFLPAFNKKTLFIRDDGKIGVNIELVWATPWINTIRMVDSRCGFLHYLIFPCLNIVPSRCQQCWKVVARPKTVTQLFAILEYQETLDVPCKCGIETRPFTSGLYGAYWYCSSVEQGLERKEQVIEAMREIDINVPSPLGDIPVILKRACTEYERKFPVSLQWTVTEEQEALEKLVDDTLVMPEEMEDWKDPWFIDLSVKSQWIEHACQRGDMTYLEYTDGQELNSPLVVYDRDEEGRIRGLLPNHVVKDEDCDCGHCPDCAMKEAQGKEV